MDTRYAMIALCALAMAALAGGCDSMLRGTVDPAQYLGKEPPMTLLLAEYHGPDAAKLANAARDQLHEEGFGEAFVIGDADEAFLCHSLYKGFDEKRYEKDRDRLAMIADRATGRPRFGRPWASPLPEPTPLTPHDLLQAGGKYTVQVGAFDLYGRKTDAIRFTEQLRRKGWDAYTYHGDTQSLVTVGTFGDRIFDNPYRKGNPLDPAQIVSPEVKRILEAFPFLTWNGHTFTAEEAAEVTMTSRAIDPVTGKMGQTTTDASIYMRSKLVHVPEASRSFMPAPMLPTPPGPIRSPLGPPGGR